MKHRPKPVEDPDLTLLERLLRYHALTLRDLSRHTGIPRATLWHIVRGRIPRVDVAITIAKHFQCRVEDIWD